MIKRFGFGRLLIILILSGVLGMLFVYYQFTSVPQLEDTNRELRRNNSQISETTENLEELKAGIEKFQTQQQDFLRIKDQYDFFNAQDRVEARRKLNTIRDMSRLTSAQYNIRPASEVRDPALRDVGYKLLDTPIEFNMQAIEDKDIYTFLYHLNYSFPGQIIINEISIVRDEEVTVPLLRDIGTGQEDIRALVSARVTASWQTLVPDTTFSINDEGRNE